MPVTEKNEGANVQDSSHRFLRPLILPVLIQVIRGVLCIAFDYWLGIRGLPNRPPGGPVVAVYIPPIFFLLGGLDVLLAILLLRFKEHRAIFYSLVLWNILLAFAPVWFPIGALFVYDWFLSALSLSICVLSLLHLVLLFREQLRIENL
ncbi:MAG: hypothetical protein GF309_11575 [Candidatus Lokiarchaeota archaeon]|nr:hypothetical protein [Candidatus Lokiarchaeota archaeon]